MLIVIFANNIYIVLIKFNVEIIFRRNILIFTVLRVLFVSITRGEEKRPEVNVFLVSIFIIKRVKFILVI